jgi:hypothetical protein
VPHDHGVHRGAAQRRSASAHLRAASPRPTRRRRRRSAAPPRPRRSRPPLDRAIEPAARRLTGRTVTIARRSSEARTCTLAGRRSPPALIVRATGPLHARPPPSITGTAQGCPRPPHEKGRRSFVLRTAIAAAARHRRPPRPPWDVRRPQGGATAGSAPTMASSVVSTDSLRQLARRRRPATRTLIGDSRSVRRRPVRCLRRPVGSRTGEPARTTHCRRAPSTGACAAVINDLLDTLGGMGTVWPVPRGRAPRVRRDGRSSWTSWCLARSAW